MTMSDYFIKRVNQLRALTLPFPEGFLVDMLPELFPSSVQSLWQLLSTGTRTNHRPDRRISMSAGTCLSTEKSALGTSALGQ
jgi:hypothetical protein